MWENENDPVTYYSACSTTTFNAESVNGGVLIPPICSAGSGPDPTQFQPFCATSPQTTCTTFWTDANQPGLTFCARWSVNIAASVYYGTPMLGAGQNDSWSYFGVKTDRFTWPQYTGFASGNDPNPPTLPAKAAPHGRVTTSALNFLGADADPASAVGSATWGANPAGVFSTADYSIALDAFPSQEYLYRLLGQGQIPSNLSYAGFLEVSARWQDNPPSSGIGTDWSAAMDAACPSNNEPFSVLQGTISHTPSQTSPSSFPGLDPTVARLALNCLDEMVASSRFPDAQAFAADLAPAFGPGSGTSRGLAASLARIVSRASELRTDRTSPAVRTVPFLSGATIADQAGGVLDALVASEAALDALMQQGAGYSTAVAGVQGTLAMLDAQVQGDGAAMQADEEFMRSIAAVAARLNETYVEAIAKSNATLKVFEAGVRKKISEEVGEAVFQFFASAVAVVLGDVGAIAGMAAAAEGALGQAVKDVEKIASFLSNLGNLVNSIFTLINNIITFVNQLQNTPNQPNISVTPQLSASFQNNTQALVSLSVATLNFKDLHDEVFIALSPAIAMGIDGSTDYAEALAHVANTGFDWSQAQIQLLSAQNKYVQDGLKLQAAQAQRDKVALVVQRLQDVENSLDLPAAVTEGYLDLLDGKMRALELFGQACDAYSFAYTAECPLRASGMAPNPTSPAAVFKAAVQGSLASLDDVFHGSSCFCNASFVVTDPGFIGNLTGGNGTAVLDLSDPTNQQLYNFFGPFDDVHVYQLNVGLHGGPRKSVDLTRSVPSAEAVRDRSHQPAAGHRAHLDPGRPPRGPLHQHLLLLGRLVRAAVPRAPVRDHRAAGAHQRLDRHRAGLAVGARGRQGVRALAVRPVVDPRERGGPGALGLERGVGGAGGDVGEARAEALAEQAGGHAALGAAVLHVSGLVAPNTIHPNLRTG
ncbi:hypothetical protein DFJ74DRAFT_673994 [Hyaloraphidium curvatum]|nr:hypothetical protein DFJ74DRAFT_673994 [Hyaloraphidium curvatum]